MFLIFEKTSTLFKILSGISKSHSKCLIKSAATNMLIREDRHSVSYFPFLDTSFLVVISQLIINVPIF